MKPEQCQACKGEGRLFIPHCPLIGLDANVFVLLDQADLYEKGVMPAAGGYHDQPAAAMEGIRLIQQLRARQRAAMLRSKE